MHPRVVIAAVVATLLQGCAFNSVAIGSGVELRPRRVEVTEDSDDERVRLAKLREHSRHRLYDPRVGPRCAITVTPTGARTWRLSSCEGELRCWALSGGGYDCERRPEPALQL